MIDYAKEYVQLAHAVLTDNVSTAVKERVTKTLLAASSDFKEIQIGGKSHFITSKSYASIMVSIIDRSNKLEAVGKVREETGCSITDARDAVDKIAYAQSK